MPGHKKHFIFFIINKYNLIHVGLDRFKYLTMLQANLGFYKLAKKL